MRAAARLVCLVVVFVSFACGAPRHRAAECTGDECENPEELAFCVGDEDCPAGEVCVGGTCQAGVPDGPCTTHADCPVGMYCHIISSACVECLNDDHCDVGSRCRADNTCSDGTTSVECPAHAHPEGDVCVCDAGYEAQGDLCVPVTDPDPDPDPGPDPNTVPDGWTCDPSLYHSGEWSNQCDCGCGVFDPDCWGSVLGNCGRKHCPEGERVVVDNNALCEPLPEIPSGWICEPAWYLDGGCDCGCGVDDGDCPSGYSAAACTYDACPSFHDPVQDDPTVCWDWQCDSSLYDEAWPFEQCHCGCGVLDDEDCGFDRSASVCDVNMCPAGQVPAPENNAYCVAAP